MDAQSALDAVASAERRSAEIATSTPWYAPWYGVTCAALPVAIALLAARSSVGVIVLLLNLASMALLTGTFRRVTGVWPSGRGMTVHYVAAGIVMLGVGVGSYLLARLYGAGWWLLPLTIVTAVLMALLSRRFDIAYARKHGAR
jgi:hypothetical protein